MASVVALSANADQRPVRRTFGARDVIDVMGRRGMDERFEGRVERLDRNRGTFVLLTRHGALDVEASRAEVDRLRTGDWVVVRGMLNGDEVLLADRIDIASGDRSYEPGRARSNDNGEYRGNHQQGRDDDENDDRENDHDEDGDL
jgi:cytochrome c-type biogenesis protein CcmE